MSTIFLSYAHKDNATPASSGIGWVNHFDECLSLELDGRGLKDVRLWRDKRDFHPMGVVNDTLLEAVKSSELFLAILSPVYPQQEYCRFELSAFVNEKKQASVEEADKLILVILKRPLPAGDFPPEIRGLGYLQFFDIDRITSAEVHFFQGYGSFVAQKYWDMIQKAGSMIQQRLVELKKTGPRTSEPASNGIAIYLAEPGSDQRDMHWNLRTELESHGYRVVPAEPWPSDEKTATQHLRDAVAQAAFSIHLIGDDPGNAAESTLSSLSTLQLDLAAERASVEPNFRRLIWIPDDLPATAQPELVASLMFGARFIPLKDEVVEKDFAKFKQVVRDELPRHGVKVAQSSRIYLICDKADEEEALALRPSLVKAGFEVECPEHDADGSVPQHERERCLRICDSVLIFWGKGNEAGVLKTLAELEDAVNGIRKSKPFSIRYLFLGDPPHPRKSTFASRLVDQITRDPGVFSLRFG
jgi:hypothetical protein